MNEALKTKWLWKFGTEDDAKVIISKYGTDRFGRWSHSYQDRLLLLTWRSVIQIGQPRSRVVSVPVRRGSSSRSEIAIPFSGCLGWLLGASFLSQRGM